MDEMTIKVGSTGKLAWVGDEASVLFAAGDPCVLKGIGVDEDLGVIYRLLIDNGMNGPISCVLYSLDMVAFDGGMDALVVLGYGD